MSAALPVALLSGVLFAFYARMSTDARDEDAPGSEGARWDADSFYKKAAAGECPVAADALVVLLMATWFRPVTRTRRRHPARSDSRSC